MSTALNSPINPSAFPRDLALVIPVYNEDACIAHVLEMWCGALAELGIDFEIIVLDDGSRDTTGRVLASLSENDDRIHVVSKPNSGHGPTILLGYRTAVTLAPWVFQCDGDDEMDPSDFAALWTVRDDYDALFGTRCDRLQSTGRKGISSVSRLVVRALYGAGVDDVNTPFRLMRSTPLARIVEVIPPSTFAPNLVISGAFAVMGARIINIETPHRNRKTGTVSIAKWRLWRAAVRSLVQTVALAPRVRRTFSAPSGNRGETVR